MTLTLVHATTTLTTLTTFTPVRSRASVKTLAVLSAGEQITVSPAIKVQPAPREILKRLPAESLQYESGFLGGVVPDGDGEVGEGVMTGMEHLKSILSSEVYDVAVKSPLELAVKLSERFGNYIWLKREDTQPVCAIFKQNGR